MSVKLKKINGEALGFELTDLEERIVNKLHMSPVMYKTKLLETQSS